ncbi:hypothetical protein GH714_035736 [Hevea brasiliensis]|uniref:Eukaryotic translation initiation factor 2 subunit beta n=1 Tax=Hevea brasiliensis TaxID=3981 RepID=A0A6A6KS35_HEVBR|nr:hypothetical protein GH714_035736 [Hevea brasiliensis]
MFDLNLLLIYMDLLLSVAIMADESLNDVKDEMTEFVPFDNTKKKKKKKVVIQDTGDDSVDKLTEKTEFLSVSDGVESTFTGLKKKKKKPVESGILNEESGDAGEDLDGVLGGPLPILSRVVNDGHSVSNCDANICDGIKVNCSFNFMVEMGSVVNLMHRQPDHVMTFLLAELGTSGSLDGQQRLVVKGRFAPKNFEGILRRYINEYVICIGCKSPDTILSKENRLFFLRCEKCGSGRSVAPIKAGFVARVGRRNAGT